MNIFWGWKGDQIAEELQSILLIKKKLGASQKTFRLVTAHYSLPEGQTVKLTFFAPWIELTVKERDFHILELSLRKGDNNKKGIIAKCLWHPLTRVTLTKWLFAFVFWWLCFILYYCYIAGNFFPTARALIGYFKITVTSNSETFPCPNHWAGNIAKSMMSEGNSTLLPMNVDWWLLLQQGFMNFQRQNFKSFKDYSIVGKQN